MIFKDFFYYHSSKHVEAVLNDFVVWQVHTPNPTTFEDWYRRHHGD